jgi:S-DNA-T family DNA segregation ATPase FtsK/SpoIIIE
LLIAGPPRSGRSTAAATVAASAATGGLSTLLVAARLGPVHEAVERAGVAVLAPADLGAALDIHPAVVVVDDADTADLGDELVAQLTAPNGPALAVAAPIDAYGIGARGLLKAALKEAGPVVLLSPPNSLTAAYVNVTIDRNATFTGPPGRAYFLVDGELRLGQVAEPH